MSGKGDTRRPGDSRAFAENYERIFKKQSLRDDAITTTLPQEPVLATLEDIEAYINRVKDQLTRRVPNEEKLGEIARNNINFLRSVDQAIITGQDADIIKNEIVNGTPMTENRRETLRQSDEIYKKAGNIIKKDE